MLLKWRAILIPLLVIINTVIVAILYFNGGPENTWWFLPVFVIFIAGYVFNLRAALAYAALAVLEISLVFSLEYFNMLPHFSIYHTGVFYWRNSELLLDYILGMFLLYSAGALISGYLSRNLSGKSEQLRKSLKEAKIAQEEAEKNHKVMLNIMEDLYRMKNELEAMVKERTAELEKARANLELKVEERTADLEASRKAILHMMKDLKIDLEKLKMLDRMKNEFLSVVSHELRTPLTPIKGYTALLLAGQLGPLNEDQRTSLEIIKKQNDHLATLIEGILDITRVEFGQSLEIKRSPVNMVKLVEEVVTTLKPQYNQKNVFLRAEISGEIPIIQGDEPKIVRVLTNLTINALKFTPPNGEVKIIIKPAGNFLQVEIADNGIGIAADNLEKIFEKFYMVDSSLTRRAGGLGLGLAICRQIISAHGGKIWAESEGIEKGAKIIFTLPL